MTRKPQRYVFASLLLLELMAAIDTSGVTVLVPALQNVFALDDNWSGVVLWSYLLPFSVFLLPIGFLVDRVLGPEVALRVSIIGFGLFSLLCAMSSTLWVFCLARFFKGVFAAGIFTSEFAIILKYWKSPRRAIELVLIGLAIGLVVGPLLASMFASSAKWHLFFLVGCAVAVISYVLSSPLSQMSISRPRLAAHSYDLRFVKTLGMVWTAGSTGMVFQFLLAFLMQSANMLITFYIQETLNAPKILNGGVLATVAVGMAFQNLFGITNRISLSVRAGAIGGSFLFTVSFVALWIFSAWINWVGFVLYFLMGAFLGTAISSTDIMTLEKVPTANMALAAGMLATFMQAGLTAGSMLTPWLHSFLGIRAVPYLGGVLVIMIGGYWIRSSYLNYIDGDGI